MLTRLILILSVTLFGFGALVAMPEIAFAGSAKVLICHIPPGNPENFHTIKIGEKAVDAHMAHGDLSGACNELCATLCDDGNACTIDDTADCQENGCPVDRLPTDCNVGLCLTDTCDPGLGCINVPVCDDGDACTVDACDPADGSCTAPPVACDAGGECNPNDGECIPPDASGDNLIWTNAQGTQTGLQTSFWANETGSDVGEGIVLLTREDTSYFTIEVTCVRFNYTDNEVNLGGYITDSSVPAEIGDPVVGWAWDNPNGADGIGFWRDPNVSNPPCSNVALEWTGGGTVTSGEVIITQ